MNTNDNNKDRQEPSAPQQQPNLSMNVVLFIASFVVCLAGVWYIVGGTTTSPDLAPASAPTDSAGLSAENPAPTSRLTLMPTMRSALAPVTDADVGSETPSVSAYASAVESGDAGAVSMSGPVEIPVAALTPLPSPTPIGGYVAPTPVAAANVTPGSGLMLDVDGRYVVQTNVGGSSAANSALPGLSLPPGNLSPKVLAEKLAEQSEQLIYAPVQRTPQPMQPDSYGLTPVPTVKIPALAVPPGLGKWSITPTPTAADKDLRMLSAMQHLSPEQIVAPTPLPYLADQQTPQPHGDDGLALPSPTPQPSMMKTTLNAVTPAPSASTVYPQTDTSSMSTPQPIASNVASTPDAAAPTPVFKMAQQSPTPSVTPAFKMAQQSAATPLPELTPMVNLSASSSTDAMGVSAASTSSGIHDLLPSATAVPTVPPTLASKPQGTPRSGVVVSHGAVNTQATPPPEAVSGETSGTVATRPTPVALPSVTPMAKVSDAERIPDLNELDVDPAVAKAAKKALAAKNGEAMPDDIVPDLTKVSPELAKRLGAGAGVSVQVGERSLSGDLVKKQTDAIMKATGIDPNTDQRDNMELRVANDWAERTAVAEYARKQGERVSDAEVQTYLSGLDSKAKSVQQVMQVSGISKDVLDEQAMDAALVEKLVNDRFKRDYGTDAALKAAYDAAPEMYAPSRSIRLSEIYKPIPQDANAARNVKDLMESLRKQAQNGDFAAIAMRESESTSKADGGSLGWLDAGSGKITESMAEGLADLKPGQVSKVVAGKDGYYIFKLEDVKDPQPGFEGARANVESTVRAGIRIGYYEQAKAMMPVMIAGETQLPAGAQQPRRNAKKAQPAPASQNSQR